MPSAQCPILKQVLLNENIYFDFTYLSDSGFSKVKILQSKYRSLTDTNLNDCTRMLITKYAPNYNIIYNLQ